MKSLSFPNSVGERAKRKASRSQTPFGNALAAETLFRLLKIKTEFLKQLRSQTELGNEQIMRAHGDSFFVLSLRVLAGLLRLFTEVAFAREVA